MSKGTTQKNVIKILANYLNIKKDVIMVIGEGGNLYGKINEMEGEINLIIKAPKIWIVE